MLFRKSSICASLLLLSLFFAACGAEDIVISSGGGTGGKDPAKQESKSVDSKGFCSDAYLTSYGLIWLGTKNYQSDLDYSTADVTEKQKAKLNANCKSFFKDHAKVTCKANLYGKMRTFRSSDLEAKCKLSTAGDAAIPDLKEDEEKTPGAGLLVIRGKNKKAIFGKWRELPVSSSTNGHSLTDAVQTLDSIIENITSNPGRTYVGSDAGSKSEWPLLHVTKKKITFTDSANGTNDELRASRDGEYYLLEPIEMEGKSEVSCVLCVSNDAKVLAKLCIYKVNGESTYTRSGQTYERE